MCQLTDQELRERVKLNCYHLTRYYMALWIKAILANDPQVTSIEKTFQTVKRDYISLAVLKFQ